MNAIVFAGLQSTKLNITMNHIERVVCENFTISVQELRSKARHRNLVDARKVFFCLSKKLNPHFTYQRMGKYLNKDHATVMHNIKTCKSLIETDNHFNIKFHRCLNSVRGKIFNENTVVAKIKFVEKKESFLK